jgi:AraC-like DNA-binding protein
MNGAIRLTDPASIGPTLAGVRALLGMSRRQLARLLAEQTGRSETSPNAPLAVGQTRSTRHIEALLTSLGWLPPGWG